MPASKAFVIPTVFTAVDKMSNVLLGMTGKVQAFSAKAVTGLSRAERAFRMLTPSMENVNKVLQAFGLYFGIRFVIRTISNMIDIMGNFQQANANLAAIMGTTVKANWQLSESAKVLGLTTAKTATEVVGLQIELAKLGFGREQILNMSAAIVSGSIALDAALDRTALLAGAVTRTFQNFDQSGIDTQHIMDVLAKASNDTALSFSKLETSLPIVGGAANAVGISFERTVALLGALSNAGIDAHMSATALRNIFIDSRRKGHSYQEVLQNIGRHVDTLTPAFDKFGRRTAVSAQILVRQLQMVENETVALEGVTKGYTQTLANTRLDTYQGSLIMLKGAYQGLILSIDDGTGKYSHFLQRINEVTRGMLLLMNGNKTAMTEFGKLSSHTQELSSRMLFWIKVIRDAIIVSASIKILLLAWGAAIKLLIPLQYALTGATWLWNVALHANPISLIIIAILALLTVIALAIEKYNEWGAVILMAMGPLGMAINIIQSLRRNWEDLKNAFTDGGFLAGISKLGFIITDAILMPIQQAMKLIHDMFGFDWAAKAEASIAGFRKNIGVNVNTDEGGKTLPNLPLYNPEGTLAQEFKKEMNNYTLRIHVNDSEGRTSITPDPRYAKNAVPVEITHTNAPWTGPQEYGY